jgi:hypothetical protein
LSNTLNTNEVKNAAGTEVEFQHLSQEGRTRIFAQIGESPSLLHRIKVSHQETGSGTDRVRRSLTRVDKYVTGISGKQVPISFYKVAVIPVGELSAMTEANNVSAELDSFCCTTGAGTTVLFDGSGNGDSCLLSGGL